MGRLPTFSASPLIGKYPTDHNMVKLAPLQPEDVAPFTAGCATPEVIAYSLSAFQGMQTTRQIDQ